MLKLKKELFVYVADLRCNDVSDITILALLNSADQRRFKGFKSDLKKRQFGFARYLIKQLLLRYFAIPIEHEYQLNDYQQWVIGQQVKSFYLSISHSQDLVAVAICQEKIRLGVDVELHKKRCFTQLAQAFATEHEQQLIEYGNKRNIEQGIKQSHGLLATFYRLWTAKEAYFKAELSPSTDLQKVDLSASLINGNVQVAGYYYHYQALCQGTYSLSLFSDVQFNQQVKFFESERP